MLKALLSEVLDYYLKPKVEKTAAIYLSYISAIIYSIAYYIKQHSRHKLQQSLPIASSLVENMLEKILIVIKNKPLTSYKYVAAFTLVLTTGALVIYRYAKKSETSKKSN